jgi:hypothetical protein
MLQQQANDSQDYGRSHNQSCHPDRNGPWACGPPKGMKMASVQQRLFMEASPSPLSSRPERTRISYCAAPTDAACAASRKESRTKLAIATKLDRKSGGSGVEGSAVQPTSTGNVFRPEWSWACGPPKEMKNAFCPTTALHGSVALPFCHPERSRGICSSADLSWKCFSRERSGVEWSGGTCGFTLCSTWNSKPRRRTEWRPRQHITARCPA